MERNAPARNECCAECMLRTCRSYDPCTHQYGRYVCLTLVDLSTSFCVSICLFFPVSFPISFVSSCAIPGRCTGWNCREHCEAFLTESCTPCPTEDLRWSRRSTGWTRTLTCFKSGMSEEVHPRKKKSSQEYLTYFLKQAQTNIRAETRPHS